MPIRDRRPILMLALMVLTLGVTQEAGAVTVLTIGDSITKGHGSFETGGYRQFLDSRLSTSYQFIGKRRDEDTPDVGDWQYHSGYGGYQAASNSNPSNSILKRFVDGSILAKIGRPDVILLHVGTNSIGYSDPVTSNENYAGSSSDRADTQLYRLLKYLGDMAPTTKIILANIIPKASSASNLADSYRYNFGNDTGNGGIPGVLAKIGSSISSRVSVANMFQINLSQIGRGDLIGDYRVDPDNDGIVDWAMNFNEFNVASASGMTGFNPYLLGDGVHPTSLGYEIMAAQWYQAMRAAGVATNPTPTGVAAGLAMLMTVTLRRQERREA